MKRNKKLNYINIKSERDFYSLRKPASSKKNKIKTGINLIGN